MQRERGGGGVEGSMIGASLSRQRGSMKRCCIIYSNNGRSVVSNTRLSYLIVGYICSHQHAD